MPRLDVGCEKSLRSRAAAGDGQDAAMTGMPPYAQGNWPPHPPVRGGYAHAQEHLPAHAIRTGAGGDLRVSAFITNGRWLTQPQRGGSAKAHGQR